MFSEVAQELLPLKTNLQSLFRPTQNRYSENGPISHFSLSEVLFRKKSKPPLWNSKVTKINLDVGAHFDVSRIWERATLEHAQF